MRMESSCAALVLGLVAAIAPACVRAPEGAACAPAPDDTFCAPYAEAFCAAHFSCCGAEGYRYDTTERCIAEQTCLCTARRTGAAFASGAVTFDEAAAAAVLARLRDAPRDCGAAPLEAIEPGA